MVALVCSNTVSNDSRWGSQRIVWKTWIKLLLPPPLSPIIVIFALAKVSLCSESAGEMFCILFSDGIIIVFLIYVGR